MLNNQIRYFITGIFIFCFTGLIYSQQGLDEDQFEMIKDDYAGSIIELMIKLDTLNSEIARLKQISRANDSIIENYERDLYALVGTDKKGVNNFRRKFEETEKRITSRAGTPSDTRRNYYDEISGSKIRCLPEFQERYLSMKRQLENWEGKFTTAQTTMVATYTVAKGDCLWKISKKKYNSPYYWPVIWEANKYGVVNKDELSESSHLSIMDPNYIYPGQVLKIPPLTPETKKGDFRERKKKFR